MHYLARTSGKSIRHEAVSHGPAARARFAHEPPPLDGVYAALIITPPPLPAFAAVVFFPRKKEESFRVSITTTTITVDRFTQELQLLREGRFRVRQSALILPFVYFVFRIFVGGSLCLCGRDRWCTPRLHAFPAK